MPAFPRDPSPDSTIAFLRQGYRFFTNRRRTLGSDTFETRLLLRRAVSVMGEEAVRMFYQPGRFTRNGAVPPSTLMLLQGRGSVITLDGAEHTHRKQMFISLLEQEAIIPLVVEAERQWRERISCWQEMDQVVLFPEVGEIIFRSVCAWSGVDVADDEVSERTRQLQAAVDGSGSAGPRMWWGLVQRLRVKSWAVQVIEDARAGRRTPAQSTVLQTVAAHRDRDGSLLEARVAARELLNIIRPAVAVSRYITLMAVLLRYAPWWRQQLQGADDPELERFVLEVRRLAPFVPAMGGRVLEPFEWRGHHFAKGDWVLLDFYGTNRDERSWDDPRVFRPERFRSWDGSPFNYIPQGGGEVATGHRCPGERTTIELMKLAARMLAAEVDYDVPEQDLRVNLARMLALPNSRFVITNVRRRAGVPAQEAPVAARTG